MRYAISIPPFTDVATVVSLAVDAEQAGWDGVFLWDHLVWRRGLGLDVHDPWVVLGALAARTSRVRLGTLVTPLSRRRPWVVAKQLTTLDHLSGGRAVLGVGLGEPPDADFADFGEVSEARERAGRLDEGLEVVDGLLRGPLVHHGPHHDVDTEIRPRPVQQPRPPIWVAAVAPNRRPLQRALGWDGVAVLGPNEYVTPGEVGEYLADAERPDGWDVVAGWAPGVPADEYVDVGVTWLVESRPPFGDWVDSLRSRIRCRP